MARSIQLLDIGPSGNVKNPEEAFQSDKTLCKYCKKNIAIKDGHCYAYECLLKAKGLKKKGPVEIPLLRECVICHSTFSTKRTREYICVCQKDECLKKYTEIKDRKTNRRRPIFSNKFKQF